MGSVVHESEPVSGITEWKSVAMKGLERWKVGEESKENKIR
jgi:hypothetical protein